MKKIFKYLGIAIAVLLLIVIVSVWIFFAIIKTGSTLITLS